MPVPSNTARLRGEKPDLGGAPQSVLQESRGGIQRFRGVR